MRRPRPLSPGRGTLALGAAATATLGAVVVVELRRVWRRGSAQALSAEHHPILASEKAVAETAQIARAGYKDVSTRENALFNLLTSFATTFIVVRSVTYLLRGRRSFGPLRNLRLGRRHIHHYVPGIVIAFASGTGAILTRDERVEPFLAIPFGVGMGLTLDESALLLDLEDVYWTHEGLLSVQITLTVIAMLGALALGLRFLWRGEQIVLDPAAQ
jgi:hypothetical protein